MCPGCGQAPLSPGRARSRMRGERRAASARRCFGRGSRKRQHGRLPPHSCLRKGSSGAVAIEFHSRGFRCRLDASAPAVAPHTLARDEEQASRVTPSLLQFAQRSTLPPTGRSVGDRRKEQQARRRLSSAPACRAAGCCQRTCQQEPNLFKATPSGRTGPGPRSRRRHVSGTARQGAGASHRHLYHRPWRRANSSAGFATPRSLARCKRPRPSRTRCVPIHPRGRTHLSRQGP